jgi:hypothetical protein
MQQQRAPEKDLILAGDYNLKPGEFDEALNQLKQPLGPF